MHRSGTSLMSGILRILGINFGDNLMPANESNELGYFEHNDIYGNNEKILRQLNSSWDDINELPENWHKAQEMVFYKEEIKDIIRRDFGSCKVFGIKDPRISILLPLYLEILAELNIEPCFVVICRNAAETVRSLEKRNNFDLLKSANLIKKYQESIEKYTQNGKKVYISFEDLVSYPKFAVEKIKDNLGIKLKNFDTFESDLVRFIDPRLKHHNLPEDQLLRELFLSLDVAYKDLEKEEEVIISKEKEIKEIKLSKEKETAVLSSELKEKELILDNLSKALLEKDEQIKSQGIEFENLKTFLSVKEEQIRKDELIVQGKNLLIGQLEENAKNKELKIASLKTSFESAKRTIANMERSLTWRLTQKIEKVVYFVLPARSAGRVFYNNLIVKLQGGILPPIKEERLTLPSPKNIDKEKLIYIQALKNTVHGIKPKSNISIITITKNLALLEKCLNSVFEQTSYKNFEWIVVLDCPDNEKSIGPFNDARIKIIKPGKELSFSEANNLAARSASGEFLVFLNDDTEVLPNWLENMLAVHSAKEKVGAVGNILIYPEKNGNKENIENYPAFSIQHRGIKFKLDSDGIKPFNIGKFEDPLKLGQELYAVPAVTAACLLIKKSIFEEIGGFDEDYIFGYEDVDLGLKLLARGYFNVISTKSFVYHRESASILNEDSKKISENRINNKKILIKKWGDILFRGIMENMIDGKDFFIFSKMKIGFVVSESDENTVRGDYFTAKGLSKFLEKRGYDTYFIDSKNPRVEEDTNIVVLMVDNFNFNLIAKSKIPIKIAWIRNRVHEWLLTDWLSSMDIVFCSSKEIERIVRNKIKKENIFMLKIGADTDLFKPQDVDKKYDLVFVGSCWGKEREILESIRELKEFNLRIFGLGWDHFEEIRDFYGGVAPYSSVPEIYNSAYIVLDDQISGHSKEYNSINSRVFEAMACGKAVVTNANSDIHRVMGECVFSVSSPHEIKKVVENLLMDKEKLFLIGQKARELIVKKHSYEIRAEEFVQILKKISADKKFKDENIN